jgi:hypothetical protein
MQLKYSISELDAATRALAEATALNESGLKQFLFTHRYEILGISAAVILGYLAYIKLSGIILSGV